MKTLASAALVLPLSAVLLHADVMAQSGGTPSSRPPVQSSGKGTNSSQLPIQDESEIILGFSKKYTALGKPSVFIEFGAQDLYLQAAFERPLLAAGAQIVGVKTPVSSSKKSPSKDQKADLIIHVDATEEEVPLYKPSGLDESRPRWRFIVHATRTMKDGSGMLLGRVDSDHLFSLEGASVGILARHVLHVSGTDVATQTALELMRQIAAGQ